VICVYFDMCILNQRNLVGLELVDNKVNDMGENVVIIIGGL
jgi:hypothetical protein